MNMAYGQVYVHCVWSTKNHNKCILLEQEPVLYGEMRRKCDALKCTLVAANGMSDHVHVLVRVWPSVSVFKVAEYVKHQKRRHAEGVVLDALERCWFG